MEEQNKRTNIMQNRAKCEGENKKQNLHSKVNVVKAFTTSIPYLCLSLTRSLLSPLSYSLFPCTCQSEGFSLSLSLYVSLHTTPHTHTRASSKMLKASFLKSLKEKIQSIFVRTARSLSAPSLSQRAVFLHAEQTCEFSNHHDPPTLCRRSDKKRNLSMSETDHIRENRINVYRRCENIALHDGIHQRR